MYLKCAHPDCSTDFDHTEGRLFRFQQTPQHEGQPSHWHGLKHYWLCGRCSEDFTIEYQDRVGVVLKARQETTETIHIGQSGYYVLQEEFTHDEVEVSDRRSGCAAVRARSIEIELDEVAQGELDINEIGFRKGEHDPDE